MTPGAASAAAGAVVEVEDSSRSAAQRVTLQSQRDGTSSLMPPAKASEMAREGVLPPAPIKLETVTAYLSRQSVE
jgi:hypothetical protein